LRGTVRELQGNVTSEKYVLELSRTAPQSDTVMLGVNRTPPQDRCVRSEKSRGLPMISGHVPATIASVCPLSETKNDVAMRLSGDKVAAI